jgi:hypothetical protein
MEVGDASRNASTSNKVFWNWIVLYQRNVRSSIVACNNADGSQCVVGVEALLHSFIHKTQNQSFQISCIHVACDNFI